MKILHIIASPRWERSKSKLLWDFTSNQLNGEVITLDLYNSEVPFISNNVITYNYGYMKYEDLNAEDKKIADLQQSYIDTIKSVDVVVVSAPLWNFGMPGILKAYIDLIAKVGETFAMTESGLVGLLSNIKKWYIVTSKWGVYKDTAWSHIETLEPNIQQAFQFLGINNVSTFALEGTNSKDEATLNAEIDNIKNEINKSL